MEIKLLYKYKNGDERNVKDLLANKLWVSKYKFLNDPCDLMFSLEKEGLKEYGVDDSNLEDCLKCFCETIYDAQGVISFGISPRNNRLWSYYAGGFSGFVSCYKKVDVEKSLLKANKEDWAGNLVKYTNDKTDMTETLKKSLTIKPNEYDFPIKWPKFFQKRPFWKMEHEYRYSVRKNFYKKNKNGRNLQNLKPFRMYLGFKLNENLKAKIISYCANQGISCFVCRPDFFGNLKKIIIKKLFKS